MPKCRNCGKEISRYGDYDICPHCGIPDPIPVNYETMDVTKTIKKMAEENADLYRSKSKNTYVLLCLFLGFCGAHSFYILKKTSGFIDIAIALAVTALVGTLLYFLVPALSFFGFLVGFGAAFLCFAIYSFVLRGQDSLKDGNGEYLR